MNVQNDQTRPLISIITPSYNSETYLPDAIRSVQAQTYTNWEMIITDDCSTDNTIIVIQPFLDDERIKLIQLSENSGPGVARNTSIEAANGRYLAFLDADDQWLPEKLEKQSRFMQEEQVAFSFTPYKKVKKDGTDTGTIVRAPERIEYKQLLKQNVIGCLTVMLDREMIGEVKMNPMRTRQDFALWLSLCRRGWPAYGLQEVLAKYRVVDHSISSNKITMAKNNWRMYRDVEQLSVPRSLWYFFHYVTLSLKKYLAK
ncbi:glycosyltransferase family 2 protein [Salicibibacter halophilus]|uniref:Glycosyltransferase family 2 protein n=1 Tax=Salicibibacter halophilus TaxID=2502791 RepID=A0A514LIE7_9BACI|nr:glycosyltransferase family 2 protein [Salicibibacter halophilus]QDI91617.1 glycosyltransferase family 2 protein [Salicibibacter halophilus]